MTKKRTKSALRKRYEELLDISREAIRELMSDWDEDLKTLHKDYAQSVSMSTMYHFMRGSNSISINTLLGMCTLVEIHPVGIDCREMLNTFLDDVNTTVRALLTVYTKMDLADRLNMDRRSVYRMCDTRILQTRKLTPFLQNIDSVINELPPNKYYMFESAREENSK